MKHPLLKGVPKDEVAEVRANFASAALFRKHLRKVLEREISSIYRDLENEEYINCPNYGELVASKIQRVKALKQVIGWCEDEEK